MLETLFLQTQREGNNLLKFSQPQIAFEAQLPSSSCLIASTLFHLGRKPLAYTIIFAKRTSVGGCRSEMKGLLL